MGQPVWPLFGAAYALSVRLRPNHPGYTETHPAIVRLPPRYRAASQDQPSIPAAACGRCAAKCAAHTSIMLPAPISNTRWLDSRSKMRCASRTAADAMETECAPIWVCPRAAFAAKKLCCTKRFKYAPSAPASSAARAAAFNWPRICVSPNTIESSPDATRKTWRTALECGSVYRCGVNSLKGIWRQADSQRAAHCAYPASIEACMDDALPVSAAP